MTVWKSISSLWVLFVVLLIYVSGEQQGYAESADGTGETGRVKRQGWGDEGGFRGLGTVPASTTSTRGIGTVSTSTTSTRGIGTVSTATPPTTSPSMISTLPYEGMTDDKYLVLIGESNDVTTMASEGSFGAYSVSVLCLVIYTGLVTLVIG